ncbi:MAG: histone H1 [Bacteroidaceae bacterium]|nr:histone H1 [Bacteroidaceae bacterium]MBQ8676611.1 histone H1 [Bacteroidaceae bacterium]MBQ9176101.1 histone H1 [Bacteroidaceae bacterium]MBR1378899.1 histone H1 [Bacteroidaceae bacterium]
MKELIAKINELVDVIKADVEKSESNKAAAARVRKATLELEKVGKEYRKASIAAAKK